MNKNNNIIIIKRIKEAFHFWTMSLSDNEKHAIRKYSYNSIDLKKPNRFFERLNKMLRGNYNKNDKNKLQRYAKIISSAIQKADLPFDIVCYRGVDINPVIDISVGTIFTFDQFISTSIIREKALRKKFMLIIYVPAKAKGAYIEELSCFPKQREFLLDNSCRYKLLPVKGNVIKLEVQV